MSPRSGWGSWGILGGSGESRCDRKGLKVKIGSSLAINRQPSERSKGNDRIGLADGLRPISRNRSPRLLRPQLRLNDLNDYEMES